MKYCNANAVEEVEPGCASPKLNTSWFAMTDLMTR